ncbi:MAG TPA: SDR family oxidoreductase [Ignavibacteriales bacterium]|nr:SDR family oxidoreductase [Ignavibacteriales bacterium]
MYAYTNSYEHTTKASYSTDESSGSPVLPGNYPKICGGRILVTGGAGFIGSNMCEDFLKNDNEVVCLDNFSTGKVENIKGFLSCPKFHLVVGDIRNINDCRKAVDGADVVFHEAALGSVPRSLQDPITSNEVNVGGFLNMLVAAKDANVRRFIYAASSAAYGDSKALPKVESSVGRPVSPYAVSKYANELYAHVFGLHYGMEIIGLRYFNVFGPRQNPDGEYAAVIPRFTSQLISHRPILINGDGNISRDFTYVENVIQMNHLAGLCKDSNAFGEVFNTAAGQRNSLNALVKYLKEFLSLYDPEIPEVEVRYGTFRKGDVQHSLASIEKAEKILGYKPQFNFEQGLKLSMDWYWKNLSR